MEKGCDSAMRGCVDSVMRGCVDRVLLRSVQGRVLRHIGEKIRWVEKVGGYQGVLMCVIECVFV